MRLLVDLQGAQGVHRLTRAGRHALRLVKALAETARGAPACELHVLLNESMTHAAAEIRHGLAGLVSNDCVHGFRTVGPTEARDPENGHRATLAARLRAVAISKLRADAVLLTGPYDGYADEAIVTLCPQADGIPVALLLHDLPSVRIDSLDEPLSTWIDERTTDLRQADLFLTVTAATARRAATLFDRSTQDVAVIGVGLDAAFQVVEPPADADIVLGRLGIVRPFLLHVGDDGGSGIVAELVDAFTQLDEPVRDELQLVLAGYHGSDPLAHVMASNRTSQLPTDAIVWTGHVTDHDLRCLYHRCKLFVQPGEDDGSLSALLEAVACGAPVLAAGTEAAKEIVGPDGLVDAGRDRFGLRLREAVAEPLDRDATRTTPGARPTWTAVASRTLDAMRTLVDGARLRDAARLESHENPRPRLALVAPLPPATSGIADYCAELIPALAAWYDIELVTDQEVVDRSRIPAAVHVRSVAWFEGNASSLDRILYHFGNSPFHRHMFGLLDRFPGVVVLHDFFLSELLGWLQHHEPGSRRLDRAVAHAHGPAGQLLMHEYGIEQASTLLPCNLRVLEMADGVIVHSRHAAELARDWYGDWMSRQFVALPFPRALPNLETRAAARKRLGIASHETLICSFGMVTPHKLAHVLVAAMAELPAEQRARTTLVLVGASPPTEYGRAVLQSAKVPSSRIRVTGHVTALEYRRHLAACDLAIQLRGSSRGETSAAVFDVLGAGLPLVVNDHASLGELPNDVALRLTGEIDARRLADAIVTLTGDRERMTRLAAAGRELVVTQHAPRVVAGAYRTAIENAIRRSPRRRAARIEDDALAWITTTPRPATPPLELAIAVSAASRLPRQHRLFIDVTAVASDDLKTGIQRVVRALVLELLRREPDGYRVELVRADRVNRVYRNASLYVNTLVGHPGLARIEAVIAPAAGDVFLGLDLSCDTVVAMPDWFRMHRDLGVRIAFVVYDILPVRMNEMFPPHVDAAFQLWLEAIAKVADTLMCISTAVADDVIDWLDENQPLRREPLRVGAFPLGADLGASAPSRGLPADAPALLAAVTGCRSFLMVGTVEPRKGHEQALAAVERLWEAGEDVALVIVGKPGWLMDAFFERVMAHAELGRRLFWPQRISDEFLEALYPVCTALIAASHGEGFGLPLIEAAQHRVPIIARDLKVFREVAGDHAHYFHGTSGEALAESLITWLALDAQGLAPQSTGLRWSSWKDSAALLSNALLTRVGLREWHCDRWIEYGEEIAFDSIKPDWDRWWQAESAHRWNDGRLSRVGVVAPRTCSPDSRLRLRLGTLGTQRVTIRLNGVLLYEEPCAMNGDRLDLALPRDVLIAGEMNWIEFHLPDARSPGGGDERLLGLYLMSLSLESGQVFDAVP